MKLRTLAGILFAAALLSAGCGSVEGVEAESVSVSGLAEAINLPPAPEDPLQFEISSNVGWSITKQDLDWLTITPLRRTADNAQSTVTLKAMPNTSPESRRGSFEIKAGENFSRKVTVEQAGTGVAPSMTIEGVEGNAIMFASEDTPRTLTLSCNRDWTATAEGLDWCTITPIKGLRDRIATITVVPGKNEDAARSGRLLFNYGGEAPYEISIGQAGFDASISVSTEMVRASDTGRTDPATITVTSNGSWTASSSADWVTLDVLSGTGNATVTPVVAVNESSSQRTATLTFDNHGVKATVNVIQNGHITQYLTVSPKTITLPGSGAGVSVTITANTAWTVSASESWISVSPTSGSGNGTITISASANTASDERQATVTVTSTEVELLADDVSVTQEVDSTPEGYIDILSSKVIWDCGNQEAAKKLNPDFAKSGENGAVTGKNTGVFVSSSHPKLASANFKKGNTVSYSTTFIISPEGNYAFKKIWIDDAIEFHIPAAWIGKGETLHFDFGIQATKATAAYYRAEASFDGGATFLPMETGQTYTLSGGRTANVKIQKAATAQPCQATIAAPSAKERCDLVVRIIVADHQTAINGSTIDAPNSGTLRVTPYSNIAGPTVYLTK